MSMMMLPFGRAAQRRRQISGAARALYERAVGQAREQVFYTAFGIADTLDGRFDVLTLHVFLILHRLGRDGRPARPLGQALFDLMFADMDESLRELGASDISMSRRIKTMVKAFFGRIGAYEKGLSDRAALDEAVRRNLFRGTAVDTTVVAGLGRYIVLAAESLADQDSMALRRGEVDFPIPVPP